MYRQQAQNLLNQIIERNREQGFAGINRSHEGIAYRDRRMQMGSSPESTINEKKDPFEAEIEHHLVVGNITSNQAVDVLLRFYGVDN